LSRQAPAFLNVLDFFFTAFFSADFLWRCQRKPQKELTAKKNKKKRNKKNGEAPLWKQQKQGFCCWNEGRTIFFYFFFFLKKTKKTNFLK
jgi:hypothetical protein